MKGIKFHHLYKALTFARTKAREEDLKTSIEIKHYLYGSGKIEQYINMTQKQKREMLPLHPTTLRNKAAYVWIEPFYWMTGKNETDFLSPLCYQQPVTLRHNIWIQRASRFTGSVNCLPEMQIRMGYFY